MPIADSEEGDVANMYGEIDDGWKTKHASFLYAKDGWKGNVDSWELIVVEETHNYWNIWTWKKAKEKEQ